MERYCPVISRMWIPQYQVSPFQLNAAGRSQPGMSHCLAANPGEGCPGAVASWAAHASMRTR